MSDYRVEYIEFEVRCDLDDDFFLDWDAMTERVREFWDAHPGPVPCEGDGEMTTYCGDCPFGSVIRY